MVGDVSSSMLAREAFEALDVVALAVDGRETGALVMVERGACFKFEIDGGGLQ